MQDFWQFPTVSMGLGPDQLDLPGALHALSGESRPDRGKTDRKVWAFLGDGETDEPESMGALTLGAREKLDNLIFVVNCNLQRLDGPVRGNGKIIQRTGGGFPRRGLERDQVHVGRRLGPAARQRHIGPAGAAHERVRGRRLPGYKARGGAYIRKEFFGKYPETAELVEDMTDEQICTSAVAAGTIRRRFTTPTSARWSTRAGPR